MTRGGGTGREARERAEPEPPADADSAGTYLGITPEAFGIRFPKQRDGAEPIGGTPAGADGDSEEAKGTAEGTSAD